jgi:hypothetical protein
VTTSTDNQQPAERNEEAFGTTYTESTERLLTELGQCIDDTLLAHLKVCKIMLELSDQGDIQATPGGMRAAILERWQRRISDVWISQHWGVADRLLRNVALEALHTAGWQDFDVMYQASIWVGEQRRKPNQSSTPAQLAARGIEIFCQMGRDEARAYRDPASAVQLDTRPEERSSTYPKPAQTPTQTATVEYTPEGRFPVSTINRYEAGVANFVSSAAKVLETKGETALTKTLTLELLGDLMTGFGPESVAALMRLHESGASGADGSRLLAVYLLAEIGCDPAVLKAVGFLFAKPYEERTAHELAKLLLDEADARAAMEGVEGS